MRFIIQDGMPYLISGGRAFPVEITEKKEVIIDKENGSMSDISIHAPTRGATAIMHKKYLKFCT